MKALWEFRRGGWRDEGIPLRFLQAEAKGMLSKEEWLEMVRSVIREPINWYSVWATVCGKETMERMLGKNVKKPLDVLGKLTGLPRMMNRPDGKRVWYGFGCRLLRRG